MNVYALRTTRIVKRISQARLAKASGISRYRISSIECGYAEPRKQEFKKLMSTLRSLCA